jgi:hypothetical protein
MEAAGSPETSLSLYRIPKYVDIILSISCSFYALYVNPAQLPRFCVADVMPNRSRELSGLAEGPALDTYSNTRYLYYSDSSHDTCNM